VYYKDLIITHRAFWNLERRAKAYDNYMKQVKDWRKWPQSVDLFEIEKLLKFIPKWDRWFRMKDPVNVFKVYQRIQPIIVRRITSGLKLLFLTKVCWTRYALSLTNLRLVQEKRMNLPTAQKSFTQCFPT